MGRNCAQTISVVAGIGPKAAMDVLSCTIPDVMICDIGMPHEDGYGLIRRLRSEELPSAKVPAIALTAYARLEDRHKALAAGFQLHVPKPIDPTELVASIVRLVRNRREPQGDQPTC